MVVPTIKMEEVTEDTAPFVDADWGSNDGTTAWVGTPAWTGMDEGDTETTLPHVIEKLRADVLFKNPVVLHWPLATLIDRQLDEQVVELEQKLAVAPVFWALQVIR